MTSAHRAVRDAIPSNGSAHGGVSERGPVKPRPRAEALPGELLELDTEKILARQSCAELPRPCPLVSCRNNLFLEVQADGRIHLNFAHMVDASTGLPDPTQMPAERSCSIDVALRGAAEPEVMAAIVGVTAEEQDAILVERGGELREALEDFLDHAATRQDPATPLGALACTTIGGVDKGLADDEDDRSGRVLPDRLQGAWRSALLEGNDRDVAEYGRAVYKVYERTSRWRHLEAEERRAAQEQEDRGDAAVLFARWNMTEMPDDEEETPPAA